MIFRNDYLFSGICLFRKILQIGKLPPNNELATHAILLFFLNSHPGAIFFHARRGDMRLYMKVENFEKYRKSRNFEEFRSIMNLIFPEQHLEQMLILPITCAAKSP